MCPHFGQRAASADRRSLKSGQASARRVKIDEGPGGTEGGNSVPQALHLRSFHFSQQSLISKSRTVELPTVAVADPSRPNANDGGKKSEIASPRITSAVPTPMPGWSSPPACWPNTEVKSKRLSCSCPTLVEACRRDAFAALYDRSFAL